MERQRYPERLRLQPVKYWLKERVVYRRGQIQAISDSTFDICSLLGGDSKKKMKISATVYLRQKTIEVKITVPRNKVLIFKGFQEPYQLLTITMSNDKGYRK